MSIVVRLSHNFFFSQHNVDFGNILEKIVVEEVEFDFHVSKIYYVIL